MLRTVITPYCLACADWNSYAFETERYGRLLPPALAGTVDWVPTPQGTLLTLILTAVRDAPSGCTMQELGFTPGLQLHPTEGGWGAAGRRGSDVRAARLLGWAFLLSSGAVHSAIVLHLGATPLTLDVARLAGGARQGMWRVNTSSPARGAADILRPSFAPSDINVSTSSVPSAGRLDLPAYSFTRLVAIKLDDDRR